ncbi:MAG: hypothetical protein NVS9B14_20370 [Candidatus Acidiferrum sp.]
MVKSSPLEEVVTVNEPELVAVPPGVVTEIGPVVAPLGTDVEIWLASVTVNVAAVPLNFTLVAPVKFVPVRVTLVPTGPLVGETAVIVGTAAVTVKLPIEVVEPCGVTIVIFPVTALAGTVTVTLVTLTTENVVAGTPPTETEVAPFKLVPVIVTEVPTVPLVGEKLVIVGVFEGCGGVTVFVAPPPQPASATRSRTFRNAGAAEQPARTF